MIFALALLLEAQTIPPIRIAPIGDSITQGGRADRPEYTYRHPLFGLLKEAKVNFDFVGSLKTGLQPEAKWPAVNGVAFDPDHEGHYGWKTAAVRDNLEKWMKSWAGPADIALIHLGTNDQGADPEAAVAKPLADMVRILRKANPRVVVLIGHLNFNGGAALAIRPVVNAMAKGLDTEQSPVKTVNTYEGWVEDPSKPDTDTFDWAHPNPRGQAKMAKAFFAAMRPYLVRP